MHSTFWSRAACLRMLGAIIADELRRQRPGAALPTPPESWDESTEIGPAGLRADSLELVGLIGRVNQVFHLHESGLEDNLLRKRTLADWIDVVLASREHWDHQLTFLTSGSQGVPKPCTHYVADLVQEARALARRHAGRRRILACVPPHHIYGFLFTIMLPHELGVPVEDVRGVSASALARSLHAGDLIVSFPLAWSAFAGSIRAIAPGVEGATSTAPCPPAIFHQLREKGLEQLSEYYGSSETAGIGWRTDPGHPFTLHDFLRKATSGTLCRENDSARTITPMDELEWVSDRAFRVRARKDQAIKVGGINVFPLHVAQVIAQAPGVAQCAVRPAPIGDDIRLKAFIVPAQHASDLHTLSRELQEFIDQWLTPPERPRSIAFGPALPTSDMGKAADW